MASLALAAKKLKARLGDESWLGLDEAQVRDACRAVGCRGRRCFWRPTVVIMTFLQQVLHGWSCRAAVAQTVAGSAAGDAGIGADGEGWVSCEPSAYSQARGHLPPALLEELNRRLVQRARSGGGERRWCGRRVVVVDGSSVSMPDTGELQQAYPQPSQQRRGCGFPIARLVALFCWGSGAMIELRAASRRIGELTLFRRLFAKLRRGDVVLGDRLFSSYYDIAALLQRGVDTVTRMNARRSADLRRGLRLGCNDHVIEWKRPTQRGMGLSPAQWSLIPATLRVRHVRFTVAQPGFRSRTIDLVTTLLNPKEVPAWELARLYRDRWSVELNLRSFKTTLKLDVLRCQSVDMTTKELLVGQIAYNLIRLLMVEAAREHECDLHRLSFAGTQQRVRAVLVWLVRCTTPGQRMRLARKLLEWIAADLLPDRPGRIEPRCVKRRPKPYPYLFEPRDKARARAIRTHSKSPNKYAAACRKTA